MIVQPFKGLAPVILILAIIGLVMGLALSGSDIANPNRSVSEARTMKMQADLAYQRGEFAFELDKQQAEEEQRLAQQANAFDEQLRQKRAQVELQVFMSNQQSQRDREYWASILLAGFGGSGLLFLLIMLGLALLRFALSRFSPVQVGGPGYYDFPRQPAPVPPPPPQPQRPRQPVIPDVPVTPVAPVAPDTPAQTLAWKERVRQARQREVAHRQAVYGQVHTNGNGNGHNRHNDEVVVKR